MPHDNATDTKSIKRKNSQKKLDEATNTLIIRTLMGSGDGRRWLWLRLSESYCFSNTIDFSPNGYAITSFKEGIRSKGLKLLADITKISPQQYILMVAENTHLENPNGGRNTSELHDGDPGSADSGDSDNSDD